MTSEPVRKEMTKKLSFTAQRKFVLLVSHVPRMSKLGYHEQSDRGCNAFYPMGTGVGYVTRQWLACMCDACSLWKGRYDETKCENVHLQNLTIKGVGITYIFGSQTVGTENKARRTFRDVQGNYA